MAKTLAAAIKKLGRMQEKPGIWQKMARVWGAPGPLLGRETEFQPIETLGPHAGALTVLSC